MRGVHHHEPACVFVVVDRVAKSLPLERALAFHACTVVLCKCRGPRAMLDPLVFTFPCLQPLGWQASPRRPRPGLIAHPTVAIVRRAFRPIARPRWVRSAPHHWQDRVVETQYGHDEENHQRRPRAGCREEAVHRQFQQDPGLLEGEATRRIEDPPLVRARRLRRCPQHRHDPPVDQQVPVALVPPAQDLGRGDHYDLQRRCEAAGRRTEVEERGPEGRPVLVRRLRHLRDPISQH